MTSRDEREQAIGADDDRSSARAGGRTDAPTLVAAQRLGAPASRLLPIGPPTQALRARGAGMARTAVLHVDDLGLDQAQLALRAQIEAVVGEHCGVTNVRPS